MIIDDLSDKDIKSPIDEAVYLMKEANIEYNCNGVFFYDFISERYCWSVYAVQSKLKRKPFKNIYIPFIYKDVIIHTS